MKTIFTIFIFSFFIFNSKAQWVELDPGVNVAYFSDVYAITPDIVVVVGANGTILKTTDGGETWMQKPSGTTLNLGKVQFPTPDIGYITGSNGKLLKTIDGGETWTLMDLGENSDFSGLYCLNEDLIYITSLNTLLKSFDGGNSFITINTNLNYNNPQIQFLDVNLGFTWDPYSYDFILLKTEDGGATWSETGGESPIHFFNEYIGFYYSNGLFKTIDSGITFNQIAEGSGNRLRDIFAINENIVWGIDAGGTLDGDPSTKLVIKIIHSETGSYTENIWYDNNTQIDMNSIYFADETNGYIVGIKNNIGTIWKNSTGINMMSTNEQERNNEIKVYPNPVSNELNIVLDKPTKTKISLIDITGKQIYSNSFHEDQVKINTSAFPKGTYILSVKTENKIFTKKIIIN
ncbi:MAG: T9SS type A sorting domain-containing protein [Moheibacter sp.]